MRWPLALDSVRWSGEWVLRQSRASKDMNMKAEEATALKAVTR
jgi:hypothetical protein